MKKMWVIVMLAAVGMAHGQSVVGVKGGINFANFKNTSTTGDAAAQVPGWHAGITANFPFLFIFSAQSSIMLSQKGSKLTHGDPGSGNYYVSEVDPLYLEFPLTFGLNIRFGRKTGIFAGAGPYGALGVGGMNHVSGKSNGQSFQYSHEIEYGNNDQNIKDQPAGTEYTRLRKWDYGFELNAGVMVAGFMLSGFYDIGGRPIQSVNTNSSYKTRTAGVSIGYMFGG